MKMKKAVLEYCAAKPEGRRKSKWGFRFKSADGRTVMESAAVFASKQAAEQGFVDMIKSIASNEYAVHFAEEAAVRNN